MFRKRLDVSPNTHCSSSTREERELNEMVLLVCFGLLWNDKTSAKAWFKVLLVSATRLTTLLTFLIEAGLELVLELALLLRD